MFRSAVALIVLVVTLVMPVMCYAHPCGSLARACQNSTESVYGQAEQCPVPQDVDDCDSTCCCADYSPSENHHLKTYAPDVSLQLTLELRHTLPQVIFPIFIPPQNLV